MDGNWQGDQLGIAQIVRIPAVADIQKTACVPLIIAVERHDDVALGLIGVRSLRREWPEITPGACRLVAVATMLSLQSQPVSCATLPSVSVNSWTPCIVAMMDCSFLVWRKWESDIVVGVVDAVDVPAVRPEHHSPVSRFDVVDDAVRDEFAAV